MSQELPDSLLTPPSSGTDEFAMNLRPHEGTKKGNTKEATPHTEKTRLSWLSWLSWLFQTRAEKKRCVYPHKSLKLIVQCRCSTSKRTEPEKGRKTRRTTRARSPGSKLLATPAPPSPRALTAVSALGLKKSALGIDQTHLGLNSVRRSPKKGGNTAQKDPSQPP